MANPRFSGVEVRHARSCPAKGWERCSCKPKYRGVVYHVQTEDKGTSNPLIETLIYKGGEILGSRRLPYADVVKDGSEAAITKLMEDQHKSVIMEVKRGKYDPEGASTVMEDLSLDELVLAYLAARAAAK